MKRSWVKSETLFCVPRKMRSTGGRSESGERDSRANGWQAVHANVASTANPQTVDRIARGMFFGHASRVPALPVLCPAVQLQGMEGERAARRNFYNVSGRILLPKRPRGMVRGSNYLEVGGGGEAC
jgi:hypothetical protein